MPAAFLIAIAPATLLLLGLVPTTWANRRVGLMRCLVEVASGLAVALAIAATVGLTWEDVVRHNFVELSAAWGGGLGVYFDRLAAVMLLLVSALGWIVTRFSKRYLMGEAQQGRFFRWLSFTLGAVLLLIVAGNLLLFAGAWMMTSFGLHQLLTHYSDRPAAARAAKTKFLISRTGDLFLLAAVLLAYRAFGSWEYADLFAAIVERKASVGNDTMIDLIGFLLVLGAMTKSAQWPVHSWLPDTMEAPTPVSALMHAGIINAGGYLVLRLSPLVSLSSAALDFLAAMGGLTAVFGAMVMMTQVSIKRQLAFSTIAQMGFMMLQCGLGAFAAALVHIVGHSLYKAFAFLNSGSAAAGCDRTSTSDSRTHASTWPLIVAAVPCVTLLLFCWLAVPEDGFASHAPGSLVLSLVLGLAITQLVKDSLRTGGLGLATFAALTAIAVVSAHLLFVSGIAWWLGDSLATASMSMSAFDRLLISVIALVFLGAFLAQAGLFSPTSNWARVLYVHALNGFYFDVLAQRLLSRGTRRHGHTAGVFPQEG